MTSDLLLGYGEVGLGLFCVLGERRRIEIQDPPKGYQANGTGVYQWMNVAIPYSNSFNEIVIDYARKFRPENVILHSTVPIGTTRAINEQLVSECTVYYSPVRGKHPNLEKYIRKFPKWYAASTSGDADNKIREYYASGFIQSRRAPSYDVLEWMKLWETCELGYRICMWQEILRQLAKIEDLGNGGKEPALNAIQNWLFEKRMVYDGDGGLVPIMFGGEIKGHCVVPNWNLLKDFMTPELYSWLTTSNELRKGKPTEPVDTMMLGR